MLLSEPDRKNRQQNELQHMRLLHIIGTISPEAGGPSQSVRAILANGPADYRGEVASLDPPDAPFLKEVSFPVHPLGPTVTPFRLTRKLVPWLRANGDRFDGIVVSGLWQYVGLAVWFVFRGRKPYVVFTHGMLDPYFKHNFPLKHMKKWVYWLLGEYWVLRGAFRVLFTTEAEEKLARQSFWLHRWKSAVVPYGTVGPVGDPAENLESFYALQPELRGKRFVVFLGRIHRKKGCDLLVEAFARIASTDPGLELVIAGPDQQQWAASLKKIAEQAGVAGRLHWPGMLQGSAKWGALRAAEVFILPSHQENFGIAVAEALSVHCPVLVSDKVNIWEDVVADGCGFMEPDTLEGTVRLLQRWIALSPEQRETMKERAFSTFFSRYDMKQNAKKIIRLFDAALEAQTGRAKESV